MGNCPNCGADLGRDEAACPICHRDLLTSPSMPMTAPPGKKASSPRSLLRKYHRIIIPLISVLAITALIIATAPMLAHSMATPSASLPSPDHEITVISESGTYTVKSTEGEIVHVGQDADKAIGAAMNSLTSGRAMPEGVLLRGDFTITRAIEVSSHTILQLDGKVNMRLMSKAHLVSAEDATDIEITGGEWDGNQAVQMFGGSDRDCFWFKDCRQIAVANLTVHDSPYNNINIINGDHITISNIHSYNAGNHFRGQSRLGHGIMMYACSDSTVENCHIHDTSKGGIYFYTEDDGVSETLSNNVVQNNLVERTWTTGIEVGNRGTNDVCTGNVIRGNTVVDGGMDGEHMGIAVGWWGPLSGGVRYADHCVVEGNTVSEMGKYSCGGGISLMAHDSTCSNNVVRDISTVAVGCRGDRNTIAGNDIDRAAVSGVQFWDGSNNEVSDNTISYCGNGIALYKWSTPGCNYNHIADNRIESPTQYVVMINDAGSTGNIIENNVFVGKSTIVNQGTGTIIRNNSNVPAV